MDRVDAKTRSRIMASVGRADTGPELRLRRALRRTGLRFRSNDRALPGSPDLVLKRHETVIFVQGCFWHRHGCPQTTTPKTRAGFWRDKFEANVVRDARKVRALKAKGWRVLTVWECALKNEDAAEAAAEIVAAWLDGSAKSGRVPVRLHS